MKHAILGAGGPIGNALANELMKINEEVRLVSRSNFSITGAESIRADLTSYDETIKSIETTDIAYLCAGLPYDAKIWSEKWPVIMQNTINACKRANIKLVFFDNVYMYGKVTGKMTEDTPYNPRTRKGEVRARIATHLEDEISKGNIKAIIARAADIYGPYATKTSVPYILAISNMMNGKRAKWLIDANVFHSFTYTIDSAKGMILLANEEECYNQIWHLPTREPIDGETFIHIVADTLGIAPDYDVLNKWMIKTASLFDRTIYESYEMLYQSEFDYYFDSTKFNLTFNYKPISYFEGIHDTIEFLHSGS